MFIYRFLTVVYFVIICSYLAEAQDYVVIHVKGEITREKTKAPIKRGEKINADERISFGSPQAMAAVLSSDRGRFILKTGGDTKADGDLFYIFKSAVQPMRGRMSTRAGGINNALDFQKLFDETIAFVGDEMRIKVSATAYPQDANNFFYIRYAYKGEQVNKKLISEGDELIIKKSELLKVDEQPISVEETSSYYLFYYQAGEQNSQQITPLNFSMLSVDELGEIISSLKESGLEMDEKGIADMVTELYGKTIPSNLSDALEALNY